jgi:cell division protein FtsZ
VSVPQTPKPAVAAPAPTPVVAQVDEPLELDVPEAPPAVTPAPVAVAPAPLSPPKPAAIFSDTGDDELLLGEESAEAPAPVAKVEPAAKPAAGGTLFERMAGLTRGTDKSAADAEDGKGGIDIPRFLNRQSNQ